METDTDDLELDDILEEPPAPAPAEEAPAPEGEQAPAPSPADAKLAEMQAKIAELQGRSSTSEELKPLLEMGRAFLERQNAPKPQDPAAGQADLAAFGAAFQQAMILGKPEEAGALFMQAVQAVSERNVNSALAKHGTPLAEKMGDYAVNTFLSSKRDDAGPNGEKLHKAVSKALELDAREKAWISTAAPQDARRFLEGKYEQAAGRVLLQSSSRARPRDISGGGGGSRGAGVTALPGVDARSQRQLDALAERFWPDPAERAKKMASLRASMTEAS